LEAGIPDQSDLSTTIPARLSGGEPGLGFFGRRVGDVFDVLRGCHAHRCPEHADEMGEIVESDCQRGFGDIAFRLREQCGGLVDPVVLEVTHPRHGERLVEHLPQSRRTDTGGGGHLLGIDRFRIMLPEKLQGAIHRRPRRDRRGRFADARAGRLPTQQGDQHLQHQRPELQFAAGPRLLKFGDGGGSQFHQPAKQRRRGLEIRLHRGAAEEPVQQSRPVLFGTDFQQQARQEVNGEIPGWFVDDAVVGQPRSREENATGAPLGLDASGVVARCAAEDEIDFAVRMPLGHR